MASFSTYEEYFDYYVPKIDDYPQRDDFMKVLEWVADKPGEVLLLSELGRVIDPDADPKEMISRVLSVSVILTGWSHQIADPFFKVKSADGQLYEVGLQEQDVYDGKKPFALEATGETIEKFGEHAYMHIRFKDFEPKLSATVAVGGGPKL
ncbi:hypothetical protein [Rhizobium sp. BK176]|uniref:hypothetical protein n=1 Tax=Rhizobium sp. BK176 TaxID=2587071 RepID=UPI0021693554|nr:hypothetical protein [Rhizobium sp. BK176]MCS4090045.1 hypothetical protein [Rhizobium sp. BK176]